MEGGNDGAHAAFVDGDGGEDDALGKDAFLEEPGAEFHGERAFTDDDGCDRRFAVACVKTQLFEAAFEIVGIFPESIDEAGVAFEEVYGGDAGGDDRGRVGGAEEDGARAQHEQVFDVLAAGDVAAEGADTFGEGTDLQGYPAIETEMADGATPIFAQDAT